MQIPRLCKTCRSNFVARKTTQYFCTRKCFKRNLYLLTKEQAQKEKNNSCNPIKKCDVCQESSQLDFNPLHSPRLFDEWRCPYCGASNKLIWEYRYNPNSYQIIQSILVSIQYTVSQNQYQTYRIPITGLEETKDSPIVTMPCETLDFFEIRNQERRTRKTTTTS